MENRMLYRRRGLAVGTEFSEKLGVSEAPISTMAAAPMSANKSVEMDLSMADAAPPVQ
jgi:hypothetical protein